MHLQSRSHSAPPLFPLSAGSTGESAGAVCKVQVCSPPRWFAAPHPRLACSRSYRTDSAASKVVTDNLAGKVPLNKLPPGTLRKGGVARSLQAVQGATGGVPSRRSAELPAWASVPQQGEGALGHRQRSCTHTSQHRPQDLPRPALHATLKPFGRKATGKAVHPKGILDKPVTRQRY